MLESRKRSMRNACFDLLARLLSVREAINKQNVFFLPYAQEKKPQTSEQNPTIQIPEVVRKRNVLHVHVTD